MKILFTSTYYNNPAFIELQLKSLQLFLKEEFTFLVMDDSAPDTTSMVNGELAGWAIKQECERLGVTYAAVPQHIHTNKSKGGLVPNGAPAGHPTERHRACLHWILQNHKDLGWSNFDYVILAESDMLLRKPVSVHELMIHGIRKIVGTGRKKYQVNRTIGDDEEWPPEHAGKMHVTIDFFTMYMLIFRMVDFKNIHKPHLKNIETMDIGGFGGTDTGGKTSLLLQQLNLEDYHFIEISGNTDFQVDFFKNITNVNEFDNFEETAQFVHYRGGSNWDYQSSEYYWEKFYRMLKQYVPELYNADTAKHSKTNLTSRDQEHTFKADDNNP